MPVTCKNDGFFKSSYSNDSTGCVEVRFDDDRVLIRDSKYVGDADKQPTAVLPAAHWRSLLDLVLSAESGNVSTLAIDLHNDGGATVTGDSTGGVAVELVYTPKEWDAFAKAVADGEFDH
ncbi:DUF397 domain-containing protein [Nocardia terpenica]|nr:DUF397 domain-containing protein [Nocardia terpenica]